VLVNAALGTRALRGLLLSVPLLAASFFVGAPAADAATSPAPVNLGTADPFAILAGTPNITNTPPSVITGNVGLSPASAATSTVACSDLTGTSKFYSVTAAGGAAGPPCQVVDPVLLTGAKGDLTNAFTDVMNRGVTNSVPVELGGHTYGPGVYDSAPSTTFGITAGAGPLILDGQGNPNAVFIFEMNSGSTGLTVGPGSQVQLTGGAQACNVFWRVTTASIDTTAVFKGTILALTSITVNKGANIEGRLLARNGTVTLIQDTITRSACAAPAAPAAPPVLAPPLFTG
jgi:Ice-binding-like